MIVPNKNWVVPPDTLTFVAPVEQTGVLCKGDDCIPSMVSLPYDLSIDSSDVSDGKVTIRFGVDSRHLHEWKLPAFTDKFSITKFAVHGWIGLWADSDGYYYVLYGFVPEVPVGVSKVILVTSDGRVYYAEAPQSEDDFNYIGTVDEILVAVQDHYGKNVVGNAKIAWWVPVLIAIGIIGGSSTAIAYFNARKAEEQRKASEIQYQTVQSMKDFCSKHPDACRIASTAFMSMITGGASLMQISGGSHEESSWIDKLYNFFKQWIAPIGMIIGVLILLFKFNVIAEIFRGLIDLIRGWRRR